VYVDVVYIDEVVELTVLVDVVLGRGRIIIAATAAATTSRAMATAPTTILLFMGAFARGVVPEI
jgi:hypothetical protein